MKCSVQLGRWMSTVCLLAICLVSTGEDAYAEKVKPQISLQLWSVKDDLSKDFEGTLRQVSAMGFSGVEFAGDFGPYTNNPQGLKDLLDRLHLVAAGAHLGFDKFTDKNFYATVAFYKTIGCNNLIVPWDDRVITKEGALQIARDLSELSIRLKPYGLRTGYHNHHEEMAGLEGQTIWDLLAINTPFDVILQQDVGWTTYAGKDPIAYVHKYPGRTQLTHYKAKLPKGMQGTPLIGKDVIKWSELYRANRDVGGTTWLTVEQEEYPNGLTPMQSVLASLQGLKSVIADVERSPAVKNSKK
jgi:sugar phosphate isomerase/epimerase